MHMATHTKRWTIDELSRLPDDGNKYEVVRGELFVTPAPSVMHEDILARLNAALVPYVARHSLGMVYRPRAVLRFEDSETEPDLMVRPHYAAVSADWATLPTPILMVEVLSDCTRRRDLVHKRALYLDAGVPEYWVIDPESRTVRVIRKGADDVVTAEMVEWHPDRAAEPFLLRVASLFTATQARSSSS
jgi:Uma2 family endonuclease